MQQRGHASSSVSGGVKTCPLNTTSQIDDLEDEEQLRKVKVDTRMSVIKPLHAQWIISVHSEMSTKRKLILDGFVKAGILQLDFSE